MTAEERAVQVPVDGGAVDGDLAVPTHGRGVVLFAHGSGSSRHSSRNRHVAAGLREAGFATLLMDLLTPQEESVDLRTREHRFDIPLLSQRLVAAVDALATMPGTEGFPVATFGASTGAAAALQAAAARPRRVLTVVSRGGRPDLADDLPQVRQPVLLVVGGEDRQVIDLNGQAAARLGGPTSWPWCRAPRTCSRSPGRWTRSSPSRPGGCTATCRSAPDLSSRRTLSCRALRPRPPP